MREKFICCICFLHLKISLEDIENFADCNYIICCLFFLLIYVYIPRKLKIKIMNEPMNHLHAFLVEQGIPLEGLPTLIQISKHNLVPIMEGYNKENKSKNFYICVCTSGHDVCCGDWEWTHSGWVIRVQGKQVMFFKGDWTFDITQIPIFQDTLFVVSKRTKVSESALSRSDILCVSKNRKHLVKKKKTPETNRKKSEGKRRKKWLFVYTRAERSPFFYCE